MLFNFEKGSIDPHKTKKPKMTPANSYALKQIRCFFRHSNTDKGGASEPVDTHVIFSEIVFTVAKE